MAGAFLCPSSKAGRLVSVAPAVRSPRGAGVGARSQWHANDIDEQGARAALLRNLPFQHAHVIRKVLAGELGIAQLHHDVADLAAIEYRQRGVGRIRKEAVLSFAPKGNELVGGHVARDSLRTIGKEYRR